MILQHKERKLFPWRNIIKPLHIIVSSLSNSENEMNLLDPFQLKQLVVTCPNGGRACLPWKSNWGGYPVRTERDMLSSTEGACKELVLPGGLGMLSGIKHLWG